MTEQKLKRINQASEQLPDVNVYNDNRLIIKVPYFDINNAPCIDKIPFSKWYYSDRKLSNKPKDGYEAVWVPDELMKSENWVLAHDFIKEQLSKSHLSHPDYPSTNREGYSNWTPAPDS